MSAMFVSSTGEWRSLLALSASADPHHFRVLRDQADSLESVQPGRRSAFPCRGLERTSKSSDFWILQDEIAVSYGNKNEIHLFNLQKFPSKPHRVIKTMSRPSSGYNDLVFLPVHGPVHGSTQPSNIIAGDMEGSLRSWNPRTPARPIWSISTGSQPINAIVLSRDNRYVVCGTEGGFLTVRHRIVPGKSLSENQLCLCRRMM